MISKIIVSAFPKLITTNNLPEVSKLPYLGQKLMSMVIETPLPGY
jgi:hypothetical protein